MSDREVSRLDEIFLNACFSPQRICIVGFKCVAPIIIHHALARLRPCCCFVAMIVVAVGRHQSRALPSRLAKIKRVRTEK